MIEIRTPEEAEKQARTLFRQGFNCAQSVFGAFCESEGFDFDTGMRLTQPIGAGMCRMREICGAVSGALLALGLAEGSSDVQDGNTKTQVYTDGQAFAERFRKQNGTIICRELLGLVPVGTTETAKQNGTPVVHVVSKPQSDARTKEYYATRPCETLIGEAAFELQKMLNEKRNASDRQS